jgi:raffinose/stachyose/melibiose transport system substrate-binding protein
MFDDWVKKGWVSYDLPTYYSLTSEDHWANFCQGLAPLNIEGTWGFRSASNVCPEAGTEWDWVTIPSLREGVEPVWDLSIGESLAVNVATQNPDAAAQVLDWIYSDKKRVAQLIEASNFTDWVLPLNYTQDDFSADQD